MPRTRWTGIVLASLVALLLLGGAAPAGAGAPRIVGGAPASLTAHPWQVAVFFWDGTSYGQACGGVILDATHVLTAAHCLLDDAGDPYVDPTDVAVLAGVDDLDATPLPDEQFIEASDLEITNGYGTPVADAHDAGLITLSTPLTRNASVQPAALPGTGAQAPSLPEGTPLTVSGWGSLDIAGNVYDPVLRAVTVKAVPDDTCATAFVPDFDPATMLCAIDTGKDACFGDSGGPLTMTDGLLVGLVSFGPDTCGGADGPGVYAEVAEPAINAFARFAGYTPPRSTAAPSVAGTPAVGSPLTCSAGTWTGAPELAYRFEQDGAARAVARDWSADPVYRPQAADAGRALRCLVRARSDGGAAIARSAPTAAVLSDTPPPAAETPTVTPAAPTAPPPAATAATGRPVPLTARLSGPRRRRLGRGVLKVRVHCSQACTMTASGIVGGRRAKTVRRTRAAITATLTLKLPSSALRKVRKALRTRRAVTARVTVVVRTATDEETVQRTIRITR